ncbi:hypothetical protein VTK73DRAFT_1569 [Phialemonium thermophilum]|uniref:Uncharacterized protein n=1 Tax=Phialemonium thermophilum TaxID=223376 RepID=A0ABR3VT87_9PEZI
MTCCISDELGQDAIVSGRCAARMGSMLVVAREKAHRRRWLWISCTEGLIPPEISLMFGEDGVESRAHNVRTATIPATVSVVM